jgi:hypothetical protein
MRSKLIFEAVERQSNRYLLSRLIAKATRELHRPHTRIPDTMNDALALFANSKQQPEVVGKQQPGVVALEPVKAELRRVA